MAKKRFTLQGFSNLKSQKGTAGGLTALHGHWQCNYIIHLNQGDSKNHYDKRMFSRTLFKMFSKKYVHLTTVHLAQILAALGKL